MTLLIATQQRINGVNVFSDDGSPYRYYLVADQPRIRLRENRCHRRGETEHGRGERGETCRALHCCPLRQLESFLPRRR